MPQHKTPGVYIKETSNLAPSIAEVATAVPAFIGYTQLQPVTEDGSPLAVRINNMRDYETYFGQPFKPDYRVHVNDKVVTEVENISTQQYLLRPSLDLFFKNGGGTCYVLSAGTYAEGGISKDGFEKALGTLNREDEPTLIVLTDAVQLDADDYHSLVQDALSQCGELKDRFCIIDVLNYKVEQDEEGNKTSTLIDTTTAVNDFREKVGNNNLKYGAAYYPYLKTTISPQYDETRVDVQGYHTPFGKYVTPNEGLLVTYNGAASDRPILKIIESEDDNQKDVAFDITAATEGNSATLKIILPKRISDATKTTVADVLREWGKVSAKDKGLFDLVAKNGAQSMPVEVTPLNTINDFAYDMHIAEADIENQLRFYYSGFPLAGSVPSEISGRIGEVHPTVKFDVIEEETAVSIAVEDSPYACEMIITMSKTAKVNDVIDAWNELRTQEQAEAPTPMDDDDDFFNTLVGNFDIVAMTKSNPTVSTPNAVNEDAGKLTLLDHNNIGEHLIAPLNLAVFYHGEKTEKPNIVTHKIGANKSLKIVVQGASINLHIPFDRTTPAAVNSEDLMNAWKALSINKRGKFTLINKAYSGDAIDLAPWMFTGAAALSYDPVGPVTLEDIKHDHSLLYNQIKARLEQQRLVLPPSAAMAGAYTTVDSTIGVWKAPANIGLNSVIEPVVKLNNKEQENLNAPDNGKAVNAIRFFSGRGNLVWGARTLLCNDNEWRYINVRRLFNMVEESAKKATHFAVFQPNTPLTWLKVKAMLESYLEDLWKAGALVGTTKEQAYFVAVGLGETMDQDDILTGNLRVSIGLAASRPAEFITLNFSHLLQEV